MAAEPQPYTTVILDIEGTTTPITFVHDVLFPYVKDHLQGFLADHWEEAECVSKVHALREQAEKDVAGGLDGAVPILATEGAAAEQVRQSVVDNVRWQMSIDRKIGPLKALQGYMWRSAYESGQIQGAIYDDVVPALDKWTAQGVDIYIYSSGSVEAQKLLFEWSEKGDLLKYFKGHFDTGVGLKIERESYEKIAQTIGRDPATLLFISDNVKEIAAAISANYQVAIAHRPGNAPLPSPAPGGGTVEADFDSITLPDAHDVPVIRSFAEVFTRAAFATSAGQRFKVDDLIHLETM
ncbi:enolase-phosphatase E1 [Powellomyces hirtus]|nr:enolase-phosphatase E1 [Powellomyces hirtus]